MSVDLHEARRLSEFVGAFVKTNYATFQRRSKHVGFIIEANGCWRWTGSTTGKKPYGRVQFAGGTRQMAYRWIYERTKGDIPASLTLDHLCNNPRCVNPDHLRPATVAANILRGNCPPARNARKTHCIHGHELTPENIYITPCRPQMRQCRECRTVWAQERAIRDRAKKQARAT